jgi:hypothetical protein
MGLIQNEGVNNNLHVSYDLHNPGKNYEAVITKIKSLGGYAKIHYSYWFLNTSLTATQVADALWAVMDSSDSVYVVDSKNNSARWYNIPPESAAYIRDNWNH